MVVFVCEDLNPLSDMRTIVKGFSVLYVNDRIDRRYLVNYILPQLSCLLSHFDQWKVVCRVLPSAFSCVCGVFPGVLKPVLCIHSFFFLGWVIVAAFPSNGFQLFRAALL